MTGRHQWRMGGSAASPRLEHGRIADLQDAAVLARGHGELFPAAPGPLPENVIPLVWPRRNGAGADAAPPLAIAAADRPAPAGGRTEKPIRLAAFLAASLLIHAGVLAAFDRAPDPLASIGEEVVTVEIVVGADTPAGIAVSPGENEVNAPEVKDTEKPDMRQAESVAPEEQVAERKLEEPAPIDAAVSPEPETKPAEETQPEPERGIVGSIPPKPEAQEESAPLPVEATPAPVEPELRAAPLEQQAAPKEPEIVLRAPPDQPEPDPAPVISREPEPNPAPRPRETRRAALPPSAPSSAASGVGRGRSDATTNYRGLVAAHLARFKRFPPEARSQGAQGSAVVSFSLAGSGQVMGVSLVRPSRTASLDEEALAMVRRASPFPPPPGGRPVSFTVPVTFEIR